MGVLAAENVRLVVFEVLKNAIIGTVAGFQLVAVSKSLPGGLASQVAACAAAGCVAAISAAEVSSSAHPSARTVRAGPGPARPSLRAPRKRIPTLRTRRTKDSRWRRAAACHRRLALREPQPRLRHRKSGID